MEMTHTQWEQTHAYLNEVFGKEDDHLAGLMDRAIAAGIPSIAVSAEVGRFLKLLVEMTRTERDGLVVEIGTLAGYSGIWLARGLGANGKLITIEAEPMHAAFAKGEFERAGVSGKVEQIIDAAPGCLPALAERLGPDSIDVLFLDAIKKDYAEYLRILAPCLRPGGLLIADNALGAGYWINDAPGTSVDRDAMDAFNRRLAADPNYEAACVPIRQGVMIARKIQA